MLQFFHVRPTMNQFQSSNSFNLHSKFWLFYFVVCLLLCKRLFLVRQRQNNFYEKSQGLFLLLRNYNGDQMHLIFSSKLQKPLFFCSLPSVSALYLLCRDVQWNNFHFVILYFILKTLFFCSLPLVSALYLLCRDFQWNNCHFVILYFHFYLCFIIDFFWF